MVVCPSMGAQYREHVKIEVEGGFSTRLPGLLAEEAEAAAEDVILAAGDVLLIDDCVVHKSRRPMKTRVAFSPLYELRNVRNNHGNQGNHGNHGNTAK